MKLRVFFLILFLLSKHHPCKGCPPTPTATPTGTPATPTPTLTNTPTATPTGGATPTPLTPTISPGAVDFNTTLASAVCGDTIILQSGGVYTFGPEPIELPNKGDCTGNPITFTSSQASQISGQVNPSTQGSKLAQLVYSGPYDAIETRTGANNYHFVGLDITTDGLSSIPNLLTFGQSLFVGETPNYQARASMGGMVFDRCFIHDPAIDAAHLFTNTTNRVVTRGLATDVPTTVENSYFGGFNQGNVNASEAVLMDQGPGPLLIDNNYLEAFYSNVFIGGSDAAPDPAHQATLSASTIGTATLSSVTDLQNGDLIAFKCVSCNPPWEIGKITNVSGSNITYTPTTASSQGFTTAPDVPGLAQWRGTVLSGVTISNNTINKTLSGYIPNSQPKNWIEVKAGRNVTINHNTMNSDESIATNIAVTVRNQNGSSPWIEIANLLFENNRMSVYKDPGLGLLLTDNEKVTGPSHDWSFQNNLALSPNYVHTVNTGGAGSNVTINHNTWNGAAGMVQGDGVVTGFSFTNNIVENGAYSGINCFIGGMTRNDCYPSATINFNVIVDNFSLGNLGPLWPGNYIAASLAAVQFNPDFSLNVSSPYKGLGSGGTDPGADISLLP